ENLSGARVVKSFGREDLEVAKFSKEAEALFRHSYDTTRLQSISVPAMFGIWMLGLTATIWFGGQEIAAGRLTQGELAGFALYLTLLQQPLRALGMVINVTARAFSAGGRIFEILDAESAVKEAPNANDLQVVRGHVRFENVSFSYNNLSPVLESIDVDAHPGQVIALLGPTGSGKTTIVNLLPRFYDATAGRITIDERDIRDLTLTSLRRSMAIVQQDLFLFSGTMRDNISYGAPAATQSQIEGAASAARIHDFIANLPDGYDTWVGERGLTLSGGQKQRVSIARTLLLDPAILILDDSTSSVDTETEYLIQQALTEVMKGRTTFVIAQRLRTVKMADQILVLSKGRIVERGRHDELLDLNGFYRRIYDLELRDQEEALHRATQPAAFPAAAS
ncbi:MAG: ABC transporter ATP-binding protein, partial [Chloroflexi bacterium]|nr:ABC transporter ATP-binding protein [Chloroflexota bacterium]